MRMRLREIIKKEREKKSSFKFEKNVKKKMKLQI